MNARMFNGNNLPRELLLTTRQTTELRNAIENNMLTDIKLSKAQISKTIQSSPHPSTNFEIQEYYKNEPRFNGVYLEIIYLKQ